MNHKRNFTAIYREQRAGEMNHVAEVTTSKRTIRTRLQNEGKIVLAVYTDHEIKQIKAAPFYEAAECYEQYVAENL